MWLLSSRNVAGVNGRLPTMGRKAAHPTSSVGLWRFLGDGQMNTPGS